MRSKKVSEQKEGPIQVGADGSSNLTSCIPVESPRIKLSISTHYIVFLLLIKDILLRSIYFYVVLTTHSLTITDQLQV